MKCISHQPVVVRKFALHPTFLCLVFSLIHVFAWKKYPDRGAEGQKIVHRRVLGITPPEPTLHFKIIVEDTRPIVYLSQDLKWRPLLLQQKIV